MVTQHRRQFKTPAEGNLSLSTGFFPGGQGSTKSKLITPGHTYLDNKGTTRQIFDKSQQRRASEKVEIKRQTKEKLVGLLKRIDSDLSEKISRCGSEFEVKKLDCTKGGNRVISRKPYHSCDFRLCPFCALKRSRKFINKYLPRVESFLRVPGVRVEPVHLVLTQSHRQGETMKQTRTRLLSSFRKLIKRGFWQRHFAGGIYSVETTIGGDGLNHVHLHILGFRRRFFDISILRGEWHKTTGDSVNLRLDKITDLQSGLREILKYVTKPGDIDKFTAKHIREFLELKGQKMIGVFGEFGRFCADFDDENVSDNHTDSQTEESGLRVGDSCPCGCGAVVYAERMTYAEMLAEMREIEQKQQIRQMAVKRRKKARLRL